MIARLPAAPAFSKAALMHQSAADLVPAPRRRFRTAAGVGLLAALSAAGPALPGCSLFVPPTQQVTLEANDPQALIYADGRQVGVGSATVKVKRNDSHTFRAAAADGRAATARVGRSISTTGILDIVGTPFFLFPILGIFGAGFYHLDEDYFYLDLPPSAATGRGSEVPTTSGMR